MNRLAIKIGGAAAAALLVAGCSAPQFRDGYFHAECDATTPEKVTECRATEKPLPTHYVTVTPEPTPTETQTTTPTPDPTSTTTPTPTPTDPEELPC